MNKDKILAALEMLKENDIICYIYRESVFEILSNGRVDGTLYMMSDISSDALKEGLDKCGFKDVANGKPGYISARLVGQSVELLCGDDMDTGELTEIIRRDLSIHSMMMRSKGDVYDVFGGLDDFHKKNLRLIKDEIADRDMFTTTCFELILKAGFTGDAKLMEMLNKSLRELPMSKRVSLIMMFRNYVKAGKGDIQCILNTLSLRGMFPKAIRVNSEKSKELEERLKAMRPMQIAALTCYLCGIKGEQLKNIPSTGFAREFYDCFLKHIDDNLSERKQFEAAKNNCTKECFETLLAVKEALSLLAGESFSVKPKAVGNLFRDIENSDSWRSEEEEPRTFPAEKPDEEPSEEPVAAVQLEFEGQTEENYVEEDEDTDLFSDTGTNENILVRRPRDNFYLQGK